jgi:hypothetical protein
VEEKSCHGELVSTETVGATFHRDESPSQLKGSFFGAGLSFSNIGAVFAYSQKSLPEILATLKRTRVVDGCWV